MGETKRGCLLTCKCPWYILSTQSVADLSVSGSSDFFQTCEADCQTWKCAHQTAVLGAASDGRSRAELSSPQVLKPTLCAHPAFMCAVTPRRAGRRRSATSDLTFYLPLHSVLTLACDRDRFGVCFFLFFFFFFFFLNKEGSLAVLVGIKITASFWTLRRVCPSLRSVSLSSSLRCGLNVLTLPGVQSLLIVRSSFPVCQLLPVTQPSGASSSADVLHKEAHKRISHTQIGRASCRERV